MNDSAIKYNRAKMWEILCFSTKNLVPNVFLFLMNYVSYLAAGGYGILVATAGLVITCSRLFDGITDPIVGYIIDKTDGKFGRFRPVMVLGYLVCAFALYLMYFVGVGKGLIVFVLIYALYILGYTCITTASNGGLAVITNDPKQRSDLGRFSSIFGVFLSTGYSAVYTVGYLYPKYGGINMDSLQEMCITAIVIAGIFTIITCIGISSKDKPEFYSGLESTAKVSFKDIFSTLKNNRPLQMMILTTTSDKLALQTASQSAISVMVFGIIVGNYAFRGKLSLYTFIPTILMIYFGMGAAGKKLGIKKAIIFSSWGAIFTMIGQFLVLLIAPTQIGSNTLVTFLFLAPFTICSGLKQIGTSCILPMLGDITDYELYRSGHFVSGIVASTYSFVDKLVTSLSATIVGFIISLIGYVDTMPQPNDPYSTPIFIVAMFVFCGFPIIGWICSIVAMKFYDLDPARMEEIQKVNAERKAAGK